MPRGRGSAAHGALAVRQAHDEGAAGHDAAVGDDRRGGAAGNADGTKDAPDHGHDVLARHSRRHQQDELRGRAVEARARHRRRTHGGPEGVRVGSEPHADLKGPHPSLDGQNPDHENPESRRNANRKYLKRRKSRNASGRRQCQFDNTCVALDLAERALRRAWPGRSTRRTGARASRAARLPEGLGCEARAPRPAASRRRASAISETGTDLDPEN